MFKRFIYIFTVFFCLNASVYGFWGSIDDEFVDEPKKNEITPNSPAKSGDVSQYDEKYNDFASQERQMMENDPNFDLQLHRERVCSPLKQYNVPNNIKGLSGQFNLEGSGISPELSQKYLDDLRAYCRNTKYK